MALKEAKSGSCMSFRSSRDTLDDVGTVVELDPETILPQIKRIPAKNLYKVNQIKKRESVEVGRTSM